MSIRSGIVLTFSRSFSFNFIFVAVTVGYGKPIHITSLTFIPPRSPPPTPTPLPFPMPRLTRGRWSLFK